MRIYSIMRWRKGLPFAAPVAFPVIIDLLDHNGAPPGRSGNGPSKGSMLNSDHRRTGANSHSDKPAKTPGVSQKNTNFGWSLVRCAFVHSWSNPPIICSPLAFRHAPLPNAGNRLRLLGYRPPGPETIVMPSWPPGSATLPRPSRLAENRQCTNIRRGPVAGGRSRPRSPVAPNRQGRDNHHRRC